MRVPIPMTGFAQIASSWLVLGVCVAGWIWLGGAAAAQDRTPFSTTGTTATRYYPAPNYKQLQMKLRGDRIEPVGDTKHLRATNLEFWAYREDGELLVTLQTPGCVLDESEAKARRLNSPELLKVTTGDGRFQIEGRGFSWQHQERLLTISNDVRAVVQWTNNAVPMVITSRWFQFDAGQQRGVFHEAVRGEDPNQVFTCEWLAVSAVTNQAQDGLRGLAASNRIAFDRIEADGGLEIIGKRPGQRGKAQRGIYHHAAQRIELIGGADWSYEQYSGSAERMTVWMNNTNIDAEGKVRLSLPSRALGAAGGLLGGTNQTAKAAGTNLVTLRADRFASREDWVRAEGAVQVEDGTNQLTCDQLQGWRATARSSAESALATGHVFVGREGGGIYSDRAEYSKTNNQVLFTGNPRFKQDEISGTAGRVAIQTTTRELVAEDEVVVVFPLAAGTGNLLNLLPNFETNRVTARQRSEQKVRITAKTFRFKEPERRGAFEGPVRAQQLPADGSEPRLSCQELGVQLAPDKKHAESLQARGNVVCERGLVGVTNGPSEQVYARLDCATLTTQADARTGELSQLIADGGVVLLQAAHRAQGSKATYTHADQILRLLGHCRIDSPEGVYLSDQQLMWDNAAQVVRGSEFKFLPNSALLKGAIESEKLR